MTRAAFGWFGLAVLSAGYGVNMARGMPLFVVTPP